MVKKFKSYLNESKIKTPKQWVIQYMENMIDNGEMNRKEFGKYRYNTWKEFFKGAVQGAYYWSEELEEPSLSFEEEERRGKIRKGILKLKDSGFTEEKKLFKKALKDR